MSTQSLPSEEWTAFFDDFSRKYEGKLASIELYGPGTMEHNAARELPFVGISYDRKGSDAGSVRVTLGDAPKDSLTHEIPHVNHVWTRARTDNGGLMLEVHGGDEQKMVLHIKD